MFNEATFQAVYFGESKQSLRSHSDGHKRSVKNYDCEKNETALILRKIK